MSAVSHSLSHLSDQCLASGDLISVSPSLSDASPVFHTLSQLSLYLSCLTSVFLPRLCEQCLSLCIAGIMPPSPVWGRSPNPMGGSGADFGGLGGPGSVGSLVSQPSPLQALQSMDGTQTSSALDLLSPSPLGRGHHDQPFPGSTPPYDASPGGPNHGSSDLRSAQRTGKLCQLLTQNTALDSLGLRSPHSSASVPRPSSTKSATSLASPGRGGGKAAIKSPDDSFHQSPTPGPGTSPPEKPQSTSNEDGESSGLGGNASLEQEKKDNLILKKLLSQDEDGEPPTIMDQEISSSPHPSTAASSSGDRDKDKNEAEPKKTNNVLLKVRQGGVLCL